MKTKKEKKEKKEKIVMGVSLLGLDGERIWIPKKKKWEEQKGLRGRDRIEGGRPWKNLTDEGYWEEALKDGDKEESGT